MKSRKEMLKIIKNLLDLFEKDNSLWSEITDIFTNLSQIEGIDDDIRSFCMDTMVLIGESIYKSENTNILMIEYEKLAKVINPN